MGATAPPPVQATSEEARGGRGIERVAGRDDEAPVEPVGHMAGDQRERDGRKEAGEPDEAEREGAVGEVVDEPADRDRLHLLGQPRRDAHAGEQREVAMTEDGQARSSSFFIWAGHCNAHCAIVSTKGRRLASVISHRPDPRPVLCFLSVINRAAGTLFPANLLGQEAQQRGVETFRRSR